jgi:hypothetical protein
MSAGAGRSIPRIVLACAASCDTLVLAIEARALPALAWAALAAVALAGLVALLRFARRRGGIAAPCVSLGALVVLETVTAWTAGGHQRVFFASGAALAGWIAGHLYARASSTPTSTSTSTQDARSAAWTEPLARQGALAALAATYVNAGLSKLLLAGAAWADASSVRVAVLVNHPIDDASPLAAYARFVVDHGAVARALSTATLVLELGAFAMVFAPRLRVAWAALLVGFHTNVAVLAQDIFYVQACALLLALTVPRDALDPGGAATLRARVVGGTTARWLAATIGAVWVLRYVACTR